MTKFYEILIGILAAFGALFGFYKIAKKQGAAEEKQKQNEKQFDEDKKYFVHAAKARESSARKSDDELVSNIMQPRD